LNDPVYNGLERRRVRGEQYDELVEEFIQAAKEIFPGVLIQLEDFGNSNAFRLLKKYRNDVCLFDDDIQGTGAVAVAGLIAALRITGGTLDEQKILFLGAGEAGIGIADVFVAALAEADIPPEKAREKCWFVDSKGLVVRSRSNLAEHKLPYAHEYEHIGDFLSAVKSLRPTVIIGVSGQPNTFTQSVLETMASYNKRPVIFAMSNPTTKAECTAEEAYTWTDGRAVFASGSPFAPVTFKGETYVPGQANNAYAFPGIGLGVIACEAVSVTDEMFSVAARVLANAASEDDLAQGRIYPSLTKIKEVSTAIATAVAEVAYSQGLARKPKPDDLSAYIRFQMYEPEYHRYV